MRVERPNERARAHALAFLDRSPYQNVFLVHALREGGPATLSAARVVSEEGGVTGVGFFGRQVVLAASTESAVDALAAEGRDHRRERMIVGPVDVVARYWELVGPHHPPPRDIRLRQPLLVVAAQTLRGESGLVRVRRARPDELHAVAANSAEMIAGELGYDPRDRAPADFEAGIAQTLARGLWWLGETDDGPCFYLHVGPTSERTAQLQGIYTPPALRGRGLATAALAGICRELLAHVPSLSLFVNDFNAPALRLYERTGFVEAGAFRSILF